MGGDDGTAQRLVVLLAPQQDIFAQSLVEQRRILADGRELVAQHAQIEFAQRNPAQRNLSRFGINKPGQKIENRRLSSPRGPDQRRGPSRLGGKAQPIQHRIVVIGQANVLKADRGVGGRFAPRTRGDGGLHIQHAIDAFQTRSRDLPCSGQRTQPAQRLEGQCHGGEKRHEIADRALAPRDFGPAKRQHTDKAQTCDDIDQRRHRSADARHLDFGLADAGDDLFEPAGLIILHPVQLDGVDAVQHLVQTGGALAGVDAVLPHLAPDIALHDQRGQDQQRCADQRRHRPPRIDGQRHAEQRQQRNHVPPRTRDEGGPNPLHGDGIALHPLDQRTRRILLKKAAVQHHDMAQHVGLHRGRDRKRNRGHQAAVDHESRGADQKQRKDHTTDPPDRIGIATHENPVEQWLQHPAEHAQRRALDDQEQQRQQDARPIGVQIVSPHAGEQIGRLVESVRHHVPGIRFGPKG